jgi:hypothetical protein
VRCLPDASTGSPARAQDGVRHRATDSEQDRRDVRRRPSDDEIAPSAVSTHVNRIRATLGLRDRVHAVNLWYESGLVTRAVR